MRIRYNAPVSLSLALFALGIYVIDFFIIRSFIESFFTSPQFFHFGNPLDYFRLFSRALGHASWFHFVGNFSLILLVGPLLEEKYGSKLVLVFVVTTVFFTSITQLIISNHSIQGSSDIVFMMILLSSVGNSRQREIPLSFIAVVLLYLSGEVIRIFRYDGISQMAHIAGATLGAFFGFLLQPHHRRGRV